MVKNLKTINEDHLTSEIEIKKSRFIGDIFFVENKEQVDKYLEQVGKLHAKATHVTFAARFGIDQIQERFSDNGEPSGTAGKPILNVLAQNNLTNTLLVVTRYFGGTLLGAGGLIRAYSNSAIDVLDKTTIVDLVPFTKLQTTIKYNDVDNIHRFLADKQITLQNEDFQTDVVIEFQVPEIGLQEFADEFQNQFPFYQLNDIGNTINKVKI